MTTKPITLPTPRITVRGTFGAGVAELVAGKLARVVRYAHRPILDVHVRLTRDERPAAVAPVTVAVTLDLNGSPVVAESGGRTVRDAMDRVVDRLVRQLADQPARHRRHGRGEPVPRRSGTPGSPGEHPLHDRR